MTIVNTRLPQSSINQIDKHNSHKFMSESHIPN